MRGIAAEISVRRAGAPDALAVAEVLIRSRHASVPANPPPIHSDDEIRCWIAETIVPCGDTWVAEHDGAVVAMLVLDGPWVSLLHVAPDVTGSGIGSALLAHAKSERPGGLDLWTFQSNIGARRFYERHGFVAVTFTDGDNEEGAPDVHYRWTDVEA